MPTTPIPPPPDELLEDESRVDFSAAWRRVIPVRRGRGRGDMNPENAMRRPAPWRRATTRAAKVIAFIETLELTTGDWAGRKFHVLPWQRQFIEKIYRTNAFGERQTRTAILSTGRKSGKTTLVAALAIAALLGPEAEQRGQLAIFATSLEQASRLFAEVQNFIMTDPFLRQRIVPRPASRWLEDAITGSILKVYSPQAGTTHGLDLSWCAYDECAQAVDRALLDVIETSFGARRSPLLICLSTQSPDDNHFFSQYVDRVKQINARVIRDPTMVGDIYECPPDADVFDEQNWILANPGLGYNRSLDELRHFARMAQEAPSHAIPFRALYMNQRIDPRYSLSLFSRELWTACSAHVPPAQLHGALCYGGLDLSQTTALTAFVLYFPDSGAVLPYFWCAAERIQDVTDKFRIPLREWIEAGHVRTTPGATVDYEFVARDIGEIIAPYECIAIGYDLWRIKQFKKECEAMDVRLPLTEHGQGFKDMAPAITKCEQLVMDRRIAHSANPVLTYHVSQLTVLRDPAGNRKPDKSKGTAQNDGGVALIMAVGASQLVPLPIQVPAHLVRVWGDSEPDGLPN